MMKIVFIGCGNMARAMLAGLRKTDTPAGLLGVTNRTLSKCDEFLGTEVSVFPDNRSAAEWGDIIVLSVKPQNYGEVLGELREADLSERKVFVSIAAGVSTASVCSQIGKTVPVVRAMPNTPMLVGLGSTAVARNDAVTDAEFAAVRAIFDASGMTFVLPEEKMNAVIAATGSSPAYIYLFIKSIFDAAKAQGVPDDALLDNICQTVIGAATMLRESGDSPETLIQKVTSKGGTTERAMAVFAQYDLPKIVGEAMQACTDRAEALSKQY